MSTIQHNAKAQARHERATLIDRTRASLAAPAATKRFSGQYWRMVAVLVVSAFVATWLGSTILDAVGAWFVVGPLS